MTQDIQPDPSLIGGVPKPPFVFLPEPAKLFDTRARRFAFLAQTSQLSPYLEFLAALSALQARMAAETPLPAPDPDQVETALTNHMPPINRMALIRDGALVRDGALSDLLARFCAGAMELDMPEEARLALRAVMATTDEDRFWLLNNVLSDNIPDDSAAPHLFVAAAVQIRLAGLAAGLDAARLNPIRTGVCPCCGGRPVSSSVIGLKDIDSVRYASCASCATRWNEVRIKCLNCGTTKGLTYRSAETEEATVKAECCLECSTWVKIFYALKNPSLDPVADDVASLGLDMMMKDTPLKRGGFNPYLTGY